MAWIKRESFGKIASNRVAAAAAWSDRHFSPDWPGENITPIRLPLTVAKRSLTRSRIEKFIPDLLGLQNR